MRSPVGEVTPLTRGMRGLLVLAGLLVVLAGVQLFVFSERTDRYFAWTIGEPLTAATLGAAYWASGAFEWTAASARRWADARVSVPTVFVFTTLTLMVTLAHLGSFHLAARFEVATRAVTWAWIAIYAVVPVLLGWLWVTQARLRGLDPPRRRRLPGWVKALVGLQAVVLLPLGLWLLVAPLQAAHAWPWPLTPLTGRAIGAWAVSLGVAAVHSLVEDDPDRLRPAAVASLLLAALQAVALARYGDAVRWGGTAAAGYVGFLCVVAAGGLGTLLAGRRATSVIPQDPARSGDPGRSP